MQKCNHLVLTRYNCKQSAYTLLYAVRMYVAIVCLMRFTLVFKRDHSWVHTQREMMHKQSRDYIEDLWEVHSMKIQKTNTNIHLVTHRLNMLHQLGDCAKGLCQLRRERRRRERDFRGVWSGLFQVQTWRMRSRKREYRERSSCMCFSLDKRQNLRQPAKSLFCMKYKRHKQTRSWSLSCDPKELFQHVCLLPCGISPKAWEEVCAKNKGKSEGCEIE